MKKGLLIIKKYKNRRLYDTEQSTYITREELVETIRSGRDVQVQEVGSGNDVTTELLLQLVITEASDVISAIPPQFAHMLLRSSASNTAQMFGQNPSFGFTNMKNLMNPWQMEMPNSFFQNSPFNPPKNDPAPQDEPENEIDDLKERLKKMEDLMKNLGK
ncbi:MAG: hypothetical protein KC646_12930 [Candidatus Cloacimonetes bacterium]|nr:hypothetical protein [Candidatus Cloacimonadota bacterium]